MDPKIASECRKRIRDGGWADVVQRVSSTTTPVDLTAPTFEPPELLERLSALPSADVLEAIRDLAAPIPPETLGHASHAKQIGDAAILRAIPQRSARGAAAPPAAIAAALAAFADDAKEKQREKEKERREGPRVIRPTGRYANAQPSRSLVADFMPIIVVPFAPTSPVQLFNAQNFFERGRVDDAVASFVAPNGAASHMERGDCVVVSAGEFVEFRSFRVAFRRFRVVDDPARVGHEWARVCAVVTTGEAWQFEDWFPQQPELREPGALFARVAGYLAYFVEDPIPKPMKMWNVRPLALTRRALGSAANIASVSEFWKSLYAFLDTSEFFRRYTEAP